MMSLGTHFQQKYSKKSKQMLVATNRVMELLFIAFLLVFDAIETLFSAFTKGILLEPKVLPTKKTPTELRKMLKKDLIDLVNQYQTC